MTAITGLDPDEKLLSWMPVSFAGSVGTSMRGAFSIRPTKIRNEAIAAWAGVADNCGFPYAGGDMIIGVSDQQRLHVWRPKFFLPRPGSHRGCFPLVRVVQIGVTRHGAAMRMTMLVDDGTLIGVESLRSKRLRRLADLMAAPDSGR